MLPSTIYFLVLTSPFWPSSSALDSKAEPSNASSRALDRCQYPRTCGEYGLCKRGGECSCPKAADGKTYLKQNEGQPGTGCSPIIPLSCKGPNSMVDFGNLSFFAFIDRSAADPTKKDLKGCKQKCQENCACRAAFFKYGNDISNGECYLQAEVLSIRADPIPGVSPYNSSAFIKIHIANSSPTPGTSLRTNYSAPPSKTSARTSYLPAIVSGSLAAIIALYLLVLCVNIPMKKIKRETEQTEEDEYFNPALRIPRRFSYEELRAATEEFKDRLGGGGFGTVFRGLLEDGTRIAVKRLDNKGQGMKEFLAEVQTIGNVHHFNLVRLIGFCAERSWQLLVYEYMSNGSLDSWIFHRRKNQGIDWQTRKTIIMGIAKGLAYLHEECLKRIVHLDIKPQNILLDDDFNAKISDFGLSKLMDRDQSQVQTTIRGTPGYIAPEWRQLRITLKVDIYSFGIVVLEIIYGRKNLDSSRSESSKHLLRLLQEKAEAGRLMDLVEGSNTDTQLHGDEVLKMIKLAIWCLQDDHGRRPQMSVVVKVLEGAVEIDPNISYRFSNAMAPAPSVASNSEPPEASVLSGPR